MSVCVCVFCSQLSGNFLKIAFFKKRVQKLGFSIFCVLSLNFEKYLFRGFAKNTIKIGVSANFGVFVVEREEKGKKNKMITGISGFGFFIQKWPFRDAKLFSKKWVAETPIFIVFFGCALFWPSCQKREILDTHQKKKKLTDN